MGPTGKEEGSCLPLKNYGETQTAFSHLSRVGLRKVIRGLCVEGGFKLGGAGSLVADETDAPEVIADPHLLTSLQLASEKAWKATIALFE